MTEVKQPAYSVTARALHWITAALVLTAIPIGIVMANITSGPTQDRLYDLHRSIGVALIPLVLVRFGYRLANPPPPLPDDVPPLQQFAAHATHWALYALIIVQPFVGWIATSAYRAPIVFFGLFQLPPIWPQDQPFSERLFAVHEIMGFIIAFLVLVHIAAALHHHFVLKDRVLLRILAG